jgi:hypothetical protein
VPQSGQADDGTADGAEDWAAGPGDGAPEATDPPIGVPHSSQ